MGGVSSGGSLRRSPFMPHVWRGDTHAGPTCAIQLCRDRLQTCGLMGCLCRCRLQAGRRVEHPGGPQLAVSASVLTTVVVVMSWIDLTLSQRFRQTKFGVSSLGYRVQQCRLCIGIRVAGLAGISALCIHVTREAGGGAYSYSLCCT